MKMPFGIFANGQVGKIAHRAGMERAQGENKSECIYFFGDEPILSYTNGKYNGKEIFPVNNVRNGRL